MNRSAARPSTGSSAARRSGTRGLFAAALTGLVAVGVAACGGGVVDAGSTPSPAATVTVTQPAAGPTDLATAPAGTPSTTPADPGVPSDTASVPPGTIAVPTVTIPDLPSGVPTDPGPTTPSSGTVPLPTATRAALPAGFPIPPGAIVQGVAVDGDETAATLLLTDAMAADAYWKAALPKAGYRVTHADSTGSIYEIQFAGNGYAGDSQIAIQDGVAAVQLIKG